MRRSIALPAAAAPDRGAPFPPRRRTPASTLRTIFRVRAVTLGASGLAFFALATLLGPMWLHRSPEEIDVAQALSPPSPTHLFGTDDFGRDILTRVVYGGRLSLSAGVTAVMLSTCMGSVLGLFFGFYRAAVDFIGMRLVDVMMAFPNLLLALAVVAALGTGIRNTVIAVGVTFVPLVARMVRASVINTTSEEYVLAARALGGRDTGILVRHVLRNVLPTILVTTTLVFGFAVLSVSALSFIGLAVRPPTPELGAMLSDARAYMRTAWWTTAAPGAALILLIFSINVLGDGLRHVFDPRLRY